MSFLSSIFGYKSESKSGESETTTSGTKKESAFLYLTQKKNQWMLSANVPQAAPSKKNVYVLLMDRSGSMNDVVTAPGSKETNGFTRLDLVRSSAKSMIQMLDKNDECHLYTFHTLVKKIFCATTMTEKNKEVACYALEGVVSSGSTDIYNSLMTVLKQFQDQSLKKNIILVLLSDGQHMENYSLTSFLRDYKELGTKIPINTLAYTIEAESDKLFRVSAETLGKMNFVSDSSMVATSVASLMGHLSSASAHRITIKVRSTEKASVSCAPHYSLNVEEEEGKEFTHEIIIPLGMLEAGQSRTFLLESDGKVSAEMTYHDFGSQQKIEAVKKVLPMEDLLARMIFCNDLEKMVTGYYPNSNFKVLEKALAPYQKSVYTQDCYKDLKKEIRLAVDKYSTWGESWLLSLLSGNVGQWYTNFKDNSVSQFGGQESQTYREEFLDKFSKMKPPKVKKEVTYRSNYVQVKTMSAYSSCNSGCFAPGSLLKGRQGDSFVIENAKKGMYVKTPEGYAKIKTVVEYILSCAEPMTCLKTESEDLWITPWHPVLHKGEWRDPVDIGHTKKKKYSRVYNLVLESEHIVLVNGIFCVTLGHNFKEKGVAHPYFGSQQVIEDLQKLRGWQDGHVRVSSCQRRGGLVVKIS